MAKFIKYVASVPDVPAGVDAVSQTFSVVVNDGEPAVTVFGAVGGDVGFEGKVGDSVVASLVYADDSGNQSENPFAVSFVVEDTVAPPTPEGFTLAAVGERVEPDPEPEPTE